MNNKEIATLLRHVAAAFSIKDEHKYHFQIVAYQKAADTIEGATSQVADLLKENKLEDLPGIGLTIRARIEELLTTGKVAHFESVLTGVPVAMFPLLNIPGFGPKRAYKLVKEFDLQDPETVVKDIEKRAILGKIAQIEGFGTKSEAEILRVINENKKNSTKTNRMLIPFAQELADKMLAYLQNCPEAVEVSPLGSLRRKKPTIGDLDFAVATDKPDIVLNYFTEYPYKVRLIEKGPATSSIIISGGYQIDLMTQPVKSFGSLLQHFTGSKQHNIHLRDFALKKHYSLSEKGIKHLTEDDKEKIYAYATEEEFYQAVGMDWIPPEIREDTGEIEKAILHKLPQLIDVKDIKGDLHIHSNYPIEPSHDLGQNTMQDMLTRAEQLQYEYIGFSEHNPSISKHNSDEIYSILAKRKDFIEQLKSNNKSVRIINLLETDILVNGKLAVDDRSLELLDATIVSIHSSFSMDTAKMTERVLQGLSHPKAKILAHPTGRLLNERIGYTLQWDKIFDYCQKHNKALEINAWPERTDLPDNIIKQAIEHGVKLIIDTDSHATEHMDLMKYGVWNARRGWAKKSDILNTLGYNEFIKWLSS